MVSVGYMDPGNWATDIAGGSQFGYELLWVLLLSNMLAVLLQTLAARMGIVSGRDLAQASRELYSKPVGMFLWILCEVAIAACDLAEVIGTIIGLHLLFGMPFIFGLIITIFDTFLLLAIQRLGIRKMEGFILLLVSTIGLCFVLEILWAQPEWSQVIRGFIPHLSTRTPFVFSAPEALYIAIGILGATVMPHNLYLHSALVQSRSVKRDPKSIAQACRYNLLDSALALNAAFFVNAAILVLAATAFFRSGIIVSEIQDAYTLLPQALGTSVASSVFAIALLCAGQSSTLTGTLAGQIVMEGFVQLRLRPWVRRLVTRLIAIIPAAIAIIAFGEHRLTELLVFSQVILSLQLSFAVVPLIQFTSRKEHMGAFANPLWLQVLAWLAATIIIGLNGFLVVSQLGDWYRIALTGGLPMLWLVCIAFFVTLSCIALLAWLFIEPLWRKRLATTPDAVKAQQSAKQVVDGLHSPQYHRIGVALEHSPHDTAALSHAIALARSHHAELILIHVVDGVGGQVLGDETEDHESRSDRAYVAKLAETFIAQGIATRGLVRYGTPPEQLLAVIAEEGIDYIVLRSHGHGFLQDNFFGQTIDTIRHKANIPLLAVRAHDPMG